MGMNRSSLYRGWGSQKWRDQAILYSWISSKPFNKGWIWTGPVYTEGGAARNDAIKPFYTAELSSKPFFKGCFHRRDEENHRYYNDRCLVENQHYSTTVDTSTTIWMFGISLYSNGKCSQLHSETHIEFYVFAWPGHFIQRWILTV